MKKFWLGVVSKEHVMRGIAGNFAQACHGKAAPLKRTKAGDGFIYYSPTITFGGKDKIQSFTAIGFVKTGEVYQVEMSPDFHPYRIDVEYLPSIDISIFDLKSDLEFAQGNYGMLLRRGFLEICETDFNCILCKMVVQTDK
jgi:hypothetical protein